MEIENHLKIDIEIECFLVSIHTHLYSIFFLKGMDLDFVI